MLRQIPSQKELLWQTQRDDNAGTICAVVGGPKPGLYFERVENEALPGMRAYALFPTIDPARRYMQSECRLQSIYLKDCPHKPGRWIPNSATTSIDLFTEDIPRAGSENHKHYLTQEANNEPLETETDYCPPKKCLRQSQTEITHPLDAAPAPVSPLRFRPTSRCDSKLPSPPLQTGNTGNDAGATTYSFVPNSSTASESTPTHCHPNSPSVSESTATDCNLLDPHRDLPSLPFRAGNTDDGGGAIPHKVILSPPDAWVSTHSDCGPFVQACNTDERGRDIPRDVTANSPNAPECDEKNLDDLSLDQLYNFLADASFAGDHTEWNALEMSGPPQADLPSEFSDSTKTNTTETTGRDDGLVVYDLSRYFQGAAK